MAKNPFQTRSGRKHRKDFLKSLSADASRLTSKGSATGVISDSMPYFDNGVDLETAETHLIPRRSITQSQYLKIHSQDVVESIELGFKLARKLPHGSERVETMTGEFISGSDEKVLRMSDRNLLRRNNPFAAPTDIKRQGSRGMKSIRRDSDTVFKNNPLEQLERKQNQGVDETELDHAQSLKTVVRKIK